MESVKKEEIIVKKSIYGRKKLNENEVRQTGGKTTLKIYLTQNEYQIFDK